jgi:hypothetical protein
MIKHRVNISIAVNAANVSKAGDTYTVKDVVHAIDGIVLNKRLYTGAELVKSVSGLEGRPAPAGHPKDSKGRHISASNGEALSAAWIGAYCVNSRYEGERALCDIVINATQAQAMPAGRAVIDRLDAAINGTNSDPISVSSGLMLQEVVANGESRGKKYKSIATNMQFDHLAILLNERPAGTPDEGIGMFINSEGQEEEIEVANLDVEPEDRRYTGLTGWIRKLLGNSELSFDQISDGLRALIPKDAYVREVFARHFIWIDYATDKLYQQDYAIGSDGVSVALTTDPIEVTRKVEYEPISNHEKEDSVKTHILAALNTAGISVTGLDDTQLLTAYNALQAKPAQDALIAANSKLAGIELAANAAADAELTAMAASLAVNTSLTAADFKAMGLTRCKELAASGKAAPVVVGNAGKTADEFDGYDINAL